LLVEIGNHRPDYETGGNLPAKEEPANGDSQPAQNYEEGANSRQSAIKEGVK
jgi:hypothetical protein